MSLQQLSAGLLVALRVLLLTVLALAVFSAGALLLAFLAGWLRGTPTAGAGLLYRAAVCGLIAVLFVAVFHLKRQALDLPAPDAEAFLRRVGTVLARLGYAAAPAAGGRHAFRPAFQSLLFGSGIRVEFRNGRARLTGPKVYLELLRRRLRVQNYVEQAENSAARTRGQRLLRRVELMLRVEPEQLAKVRDGVVEVLGQAGAETICYVTVLAHRDAGIADAVVEGAVRGWLRRQQIPAEVRKVPLVPSNSGNLSRPGAADPGQTTVVMAASGRGTGDTLPEHEARGLLRGAPAGRT